LKIQFFLAETPYPPSENQALKDLLDSPIYSEGSRGSSGSPFSRPNQSQARRWSKGKI